MGFFGTLFSGGGMTGKFMAQLGADELARAKPAMDYQQKLMREGRQTYYADAKQSALEAGYNPIMPIMGGSSAQQTSMVSSGATDALSQTINSAMQIRELNMAKKKNDAEVNLLNKQAEAVQGSPSGITGTIINAIKEKGGTPDKIVDKAEETISSSAQHFKDIKESAIKYYNNYLKGKSTIEMGKQLFNDREKIIKKLTKKKVKTLESNEELDKKLIKDLERIRKKEEK